jgi:hypothetical protein
MELVTDHISGHDKKPIMPLTLQTLLASLRPELMEGTQDCDTVALTRRFEGLRIQTLLDEAELSGQRDQQLQEVANAVKDLLQD